MVSVDDLTISLRIDDVSNLGKLQKQLEALVGKDGTKKVDLGGLGGIAKTDLNWIKNKLMEISPAMLTTEVTGLRESARVTLRQLMNKTIRETLIAKYGIKKSDLKDWMLYLSTAITDETENINKLANFIERISDFVKGGARLGGRQKTRVSDIRKALPEDFIERQFVKALKKAGYFARPQYQFYKIDPEKVEKYSSKINEILEMKRKELKKSPYEIELNEETIKKIMDLAKDEEDSDVFIKKSLDEILKIKQEKLKKVFYEIELNEETIKKIIDLSKEKEDYSEFIRKSLTELEIDEGTIKKIIDLSKEEKDSDIIVKKVLDELTFNEEKRQDVIEKLLQKLQAGQKDPLLEVLAFLRVKSAEDHEKFILLSSNLKEYIMTDLKKSIGKDMPRRTDVLLNKEAIEKLVEKAEEFNIKIFGDIEGLTEQTGNVVTEIKKIFDKGVADLDAKNDNRLKELGKDFMVYLVQSSTREGREALDYWKSGSTIGARYLRIEAAITDVAKALGVEIDLTAKMHEADVFKEYDPETDTFEEIRDGITNLIERTAEKDPENLRKVLNKLYGLDEHITDVSRKEDEILDATKVVERKEIDFRMSEDPFKE